MTKTEIAERVAQGFNSIGIPEIPEEALQELVANMFLHRDYFMSSPWRVMVFDDRVELISPGSLPNHLTIEMMKSGVSVARNPLIFTFATKEIPYRGLGSGIKRVTEKTKHVEFISDSEANFFTAKLYKQPDAPSSGPVNTESGPVNAESGLVSLQAAQLLEIIRAHPGVNKNEVARISGIAIRTVKRRLEQTLRGKVEFRGAPKNGGYYVVVESRTKRTKTKKRKQ